MYLLNIDTEKVKTRTINIRASDHNDNDLTAITVVLKSDKSKSVRNYETSGEYSE